MKKENGLSDKRLLDALEYIDDKYIAEAAEKIKPKGVLLAPNGSGFRRSIRMTLALAAGLLILSAFIPIVHNIIRDYLHVAGYTETTADETTLAPEITSEEETSSPEPDSTAAETTEPEPTHETTEEPWPSTTAPPEDTEYPPEYVNNGSLGLEYSITGNQARLVGIGSCTEKNLEIASYYRGLPVIAIANGALANHTEIESVTIPEGIMQIKSLAFSGCTNLKSVYIPASVSQIARDSFANCPALESFTIAEGNEHYYSPSNCLVHKMSKTLFLGCKTTVIPNDGSIENIAAGAFNSVPGLREIVIPEGVKILFKDSITGCPDLEKISLPATLRTYEAGAVRNCTALSEIKISDKNETYTAKDNCLIHVVNKQLVLGCKMSIIPADGSVKYVSDYSFSGSGITTIEFPEKVTEIKPHAFENCRSLESFTILNASLLSIGDYAFSGCTKLSSFTLPKYLGAIGNSAFRGCTALTELDLSSASLKSIGESAFRDCTSIVSLKINRDSSWSSSSVSVAASAFEGCTALREVELNGSGRVSFGGSATFRNCVNLKTFATNKPYSMVANMFTGCTSLESVPLGNGTEIGNGIFEGCTSLKSFTINSEIRTIGENAFKGCASLTEMIYLGKSNDWYGLTTKTGWNSGAPFKEIKCTDGDVELADPGPQHNGAPGLVHVLNEDGKSATLVDLGKWWWSNGCKFADTYNGVPVTHIAPNLLHGKSVKTLLLPNRLAEIASEQFIYNSSLQEITIPATVTKIGSDAFLGCIKLATVTFTGTVEQWNKIDLGENWNLGCAFTEVVCLNGKATVSIPDDGNNGTPGLLYSVSNEGYAVLTGVSKDCTETDIVVSSKYKGYDVIGIGERALRENTLIKSVVIPEGITYIDERAFYSCTSLEHVELPKSLRSIGEYAFSWCPALKSIDLPEGLTTLIGTAFYATSIKKLYIPKTVTEIYGIACDSLETLEIHPDNPRYRSVGNCFIDKETKTLIQVFGQPTFPNDGSIEIIGEGAMWDRDDITELIFPEGVKHIFCSSVGRLKNLKKLHIPSTLVEIDYPIESSFGLTGLEVITVAAGNPIYYAKENCLIKKDTATLILVNKYGKIPTDGSIKSIGPDAFAGLKNLKSIVIPEGVVSIGSCAFSGCTSLQSVKFPESLESIGTGAFYGCTALKKVNLGDNVKYFGTEVFAGCTALEEITLPKQVEYWTWGIFDFCKSLRRIVVPYGVKDFDIRNCDNLTEIVLPETVTHASFNNCTSLRTVILPQSMTSMYDMFNGCTALEEIVLPAGLTKIYNEAFRDCVSLKKIVIEGDITEIGSEAFKNCSSLETITLPASLTAIKSNAFRGCSALREIVFEGSMAEWEKISKGANWDTETMLAVIKCADGDITADAQPEDYSDIEKLPEALKSVLLGKSTFCYAGTDKDILLDDIETYWESGRLADMEHVAYAVVDMDGDGALEVVVSSYCNKGYYESNTGDKIILREYNGKVYGYHFSGSILDGDYMENIKVDGSFMWCPEYPNYDCYATISFSGSGYTITTHCKYRTFGASSEYLIGNTKVTREEFNEYTKRFAKDQVIWYDLDRYPLEKTE